MLYRWGMIAVLGADSATLLYLGVGNLVRLYGRAPEFLFEVTGILFAIVPAILGFLSGISAYQVWRQNRMCGQK